MRVWWGPNNPGRNNMGKRRLSGILCIFLFASISYSALALETQRPKMVLNERIFDFNEVDKGEVIEHTFKVHNHGDQDLKIIKVKPG
jgi:hypothetical protein